MLQDFLDSKLDGVFCLGHASYLGRFNGKLYLFDPITGEDVYGGYWCFYPSQIDVSNILDQIAGCFISHIHEDHLCDSFINMLSCPIYVMSGRKTMNERIGSRENVVFCSEFTRFSVDVDVECFFVPHSFNSIDSSVVVKSSHFCFYFGNDNFLSHTLAKTTKNLAGEITVAALPYAFVHYYPVLLTNVPDSWKKQEVDRLNKQSMDQAVMTAEILDAKVNIPCGASLFYKDRLWNALNSDIKTPYEFVMEVDNAAPVVAGGFVLSNRAIATSIHSQNEYRNGLAEFLRSFDVHHTHHKVEITYSRFKRLVKKLNTAPIANIDHRILIHVGDSGLAIELSDNTVSRCALVESPYTAFKFESRELEMWLDGEISFEQLLGTRRFSYEKQPNEYCLEVQEFYNNYL